MRAAAESPGEPHAAGPSAARLAGLLALPAALVVLAAVVGRSAFLIDDAFISFRYARHWAQGHGLVYDLAPGAAAVEGYSNLLWVALLALGERLGVASEALANPLSVTCAGATLWLLARVLDRELALDGWSRLVGLVALAAYPVFGVWATGGLETALFGLLLLAAWTLLVAPPGERETRAGLAAGLVGGALVLTRVEGFLWLGGLGLAALLAHGRALPRRRTALFLALSLLVLAAQVAARRAVYGEWVANTVHAKSGLSAATLARGARNLGTWAVLFVWPLLALAAPLVTRDARRRALARSAALVVLGSLAYDLLTGGDWMPFFRFLAPTAAFSALLLALLLDRLPAGPRLAAGAALAALAVLPLLDLHLAPRALREALYFREFLVGYQTEWQRWRTGVGNTEANTWKGLALAAASGPHETWTGGAIGVVAHLSEVTVLDRNGLVTPEVARREVEPGSGTAGHDKRVPRAWFRDRAPSYYEVLYAPAPIPDSGPLFDQAVGQLHGAVFRDPDEAPLYGCTRVEVRRVRGVDGLPEEASLVLLVHAEPDEARAFWARYGLGPR